MCNLNNTEITTADTENILRVVLLHYLNPIEHNPQQMISCQNNKHNLIRQIALIVQNQLPGLPAPLFGT